MKAIVFHAFGGPEVLRLEDVATPRPGRGEVLVRVGFVSVNRVFDVHTRQGIYRRERVQLPLVPGVDPTGEVVALGPDAAGREVGERVAVCNRLPCLRCARCEVGETGGCTQPEALGLDRWGGYAEYVVVPVAATYPIPPGMSLSDATVVARHYPAAYHLLLERARLKPGEWVLVMGAAGSLALSGIQVAKLSGATVIAGAGAPSRVALARSYGADYGVDYRADDLEAEVGRITNGRGVDVVFENVGDPGLWPKAFNSLARCGRLVTAGAHGGGLVTLDIRRLYLRRLEVLGSSGATSEHITTALDDAAARRIKPVPYRVMPLRDASLAHQLIETDRSVGKLLLDPTLS